MTTDTTKALSLQECKDKAASEYGWGQWINIEMNLLQVSDLSKIVNRVAELYKESALNAYKAELREKIEAYIKECKVLPIHEHPAIRGLRESLELIDK